MYTIIFNTNPNESLDIAHRSSFTKCVVQDSRNFVDKEEAVRFWFECTSPVTRLNSIIPLECRELKTIYSKPITEFDMALVTDRVMNRAVESSNDYIADY